MTCYTQPWPAPCASGMVDALLPDVWLAAAGAWVAAGHQLAHTAVKGQRSDGQHLVRFCIARTIPTACSAFGPPDAYLVSV